MLYNGIGSEVFGLCHHKFVLQMDNYSISTRRVFSNLLSGDTQELHNMSSVGSLSFKTVALNSVITVHNEEGSETPTC